MGLREYHRKRDFDRTAEPRGATKKKGKRTGGDSFVIQKHAATRLHHDFRLELDGVLLSWAVPKGPPVKPGERCLAVRTEDHPLEYGTFEGIIPRGQYGGGTVMLWDRGTWQPDGDPQVGLRSGKLDFTLSGERLRGRWSLVRMKTDDEPKENWLLIKRSDDATTDPLATVATLDSSVTTGRSMKQIAGDADRRWSSRDGKLEAEQPKTPRVRAKPTKATAKTKTARAGGAAALPGARRAEQPPQLAPQLTTLVATAPAGDEWLHEVKFDGYRLLAFVDDGTVTLRTRTGQDWTERFPKIAAAVAELAVGRAVIDGEVVVLRSDGVTDFQALQNWLEADGAGGAGASLVYFVFDLPHCDGFDLTRCPLLARKTLLERLVAKRSERTAIRYSEHVIGSGPAFFSQACKLSLEGVISKRGDAPYESRRSRAWTKTKCLQNQEFVVGGWTAPRGSRQHFGALLLGTFEDGELRYAGKVGTGFTDASLGSIMDALRPLETETAPFVDSPRGAEGKDAHWVQPQRVVEVTFTGWTQDGRLRHPSCQGLREDKNAKAVHRERAASVAVATATPMEDGAGDSGVRLSSPDRVLWAKADAPEPDGARDITKADLAAYYEAVATHVLPHVTGRPLTLVRCPQGAAAGCFYQKHVTQTLPPPVRSWRVKEKDGAGDYVGIDDLAGLVTLVQFGALELHPWGSRGETLELPDRIVIDLDPAPDVAWSRVVAATLRLRDVLAALGLESFARTTGGKGMHVVVPIEPRASWDDVKSFAHDLAGVVQRDDPDSFVVTASKAARKGRIFLDWLRNARGATAVASYSSRARPGATVAMPVQWNAVNARLDPAAFTVLTVPGRLATGGDPWAGFFDVEQALTAAMRAALRRI